MVHFVVRLAKRFAVLVPGIIIAYLSFELVFPALDRRFPLAIAVFLTYVLAAYVLIPVLIRLVRVIIKPKHLPHYCVTPDGFASDPVNLGLIGSHAELVKSMRHAGWYVADRHGFKSNAHLLLAFLTGRDYPAAPMSSLYLFGRKQDIGFEKPVPGKRGHRHHVRFWSTTPDRHQVNWSSRKGASPNQRLWLGAASRDAGLAIIRHNAQITHMIAPDTNTERDLIIQQLSNNGRLKHIENIRMGKPYKLVNRAWGGYLQSDGILKIYKL